MKSIKKKIIWSIAALLASVAVFYAGTMSLKIEENLTGEKYSILLNGNIYEGIVKENGIVNFPWNPLRKGGLATIEISRKDNEPFRATYNFNPSFGRHIIYSEQSKWTSGHLIYLFGMPVRESRQSHVFLHSPHNQNKTVEDNDHR